MVGILVLLHDFVLAQTGGPGPPPPPGGVPLDPLSWVLLIGGGGAIAARKYSQSRKGAQ